nr:hypothetical protein [Tanacetum cinerariifolium]
MTNTSQILWLTAVNTACYVQNRVLVNKSQNKTPYELFNGRTPAIGFLKPFGCHVLILNTLDHLGKFEAKGDEGTKEAAGQDVKKDVFSLRYIALPNWFHEAHLESSTSNAQDACNVDALESNGNSNPTATSTNLSADHMETLAVETLIPLVTSQDDMPSLDNILTLINKFEDILGVTTNTDDSNGVEADLGNMEYNISGSPTPTFRIHKDHPKSQIIGHVDTPVQTITKSKEMEEQSFIATIHHKTNPALLQFCLFSCFLSQKEPKNISDALKDPSWVEAMQEELLQFKIQNVWLIVLKGHTQEERINYDEVFTPVARIEAIRLFLAYASFMGFTDPEFPDRVYKVEKAMYGLHQAPRASYGTLSKYLLTNGFQMVLQKKDGIFLSQDKYVGDILKNFGYLDVRSANTPMDKENPWGKYGTGKDVDLHLYRSMIGSLMYLTASRPDIMFAVCACARHQVTPKEYSDYGGATQDRKSTTGGCQFFGRRLISWQCKKQTIVATSTTEEEYVAAASGCGQVEQAMRGSVKGNHIIYTIFIVDFVEASHLRYALTINPTIYVSHIQQFWSTARIETTDEGTKILATIDGKPRTISESSIRRNLKLKDEAGISSLPDAKLFENLTLMGYNILPNQNFSFQKGQFSHQWKYLIHIIMQCLSPKSSGFNEFSSNIATALVCLATNRVYNFSKMIFDGMVSNVNNKVSKFLMYPRQYTRRTRIAQSLALPTAADEPASLIWDDSQGEACPTVSGLEAEQDRANITKTSTLPSDSTPRVTSFAVDEGTTLKARIKHLEDRDGGDDDPSGEDATIKGMRLEIGEEAAIERSMEKGSDDTEEMVNVLTSLDAASVLSSGVQVSVPPAAEVVTVSISPPGEIHPISVPTGSGVVPTASPIFTTAIVATPYTRRKGKEKMVESETPKRKKLQEQMDVQMARKLEEEMARDAQRMNEQIARDAKIARIHAEEELQMMIDGLDRSNEMIAKHLYEYDQPAAELTIGEKIELINKLDSAKKVKTSEEVSEEDLKKMMHLVPVEEVYVEALQHFDREDLNQLCALVKETLNIRQATSDKEKELWVELKRLYKPDVEDQLLTQTQALMHDPVKWRLYDSCGVHHILSRDQEIFMLVEREYPLRKGLEIVMISNKLQVENYSQMASDLIQKIHKITNSQRQRSIPTASDEFPLPEEVPTASEEKFPLLKKRDATAEKFALLMETRVSHGQRHIYNIQRRVTVT